MRVPTPKEALINFQPVPTYLALLIQIEYDQDQKFALVIEVARVAQAVDGGYAKARTHDTCQTSTVNSHVQDRYRVSGRIA